VAFCYGDPPKNRESSEPTWGEESTDRCLTTEEQDVIRVGMIQKRVTFELTEGLTDESQTRLE